MPTTTTTPTMTLSAVLAFQPDAGYSARSVNDTTEQSFEVTNGYQLGNELVLAVATTNQEIEFTDDLSFLLVVELTGAGVTVRVGATDATAMNVRRFLIQAVDNETTALEATSIYLTNASANQIKVRISHATVVP